MHARVVLGVGRAVLFRELSFVLGFLELGSLNRAI